MERLQQLIERDQWSELLTGAQDLYRQSVDSEIEVLAFSEKAAIKKAAEIFNTPKEYLDFTLTSQGKSSVFGFIKTPSSYIFSVKEEFRDLFAVNIDYNQFNDLAKNKDGSLRLIMKQQGLHLQIFKPEGTGRALTKENILQELDLRDYDLIDNAINEQLIIEALTTFELVIIAPYTPSFSNDSVFDIIISKDNMEAFLKFSKPTEHGRIPELDEILTILKSQGVVFGINENYITEALDNELYNIPILVAEGSSPKNGAHAYIEYTFPTGSESFKHAVRSDGSVDFKELNIIHNVHENEVLATMIPATSGQVGRTVLGIVSSANDGNSAEWILGSNVHLSSNKLEALASQTGQVYLKNKEICVDPALEIATNVDLSVGNIDFLGNIIIKGGIDDGFSVISGGNIEVYGHIGRCFMHAEGNIIAHQGIQGKDDGEISCKGNLFARFIERSTVLVGGNLIVTKALLHSKVVGEKGVYVTGDKKSIIAGGDIKAQHEVVATIIGAESYIETKIEVAYSKKGLLKIENLGKSLLSLEAQIAEIVTQLSMLPDNSAKAKSLEKSLSVLKKQTNKTSEALEKTKENLHTLRATASVSASKSLMPGVKIKIGDSTLDITATQGSGTLKNNESHKINIESYSPSKFMQDLSTENTKNTKNNKR